MQTAGDYLVEKNEPHQARHNQSASVEYGSRIGRSISRGGKSLQLAGGRVRGRKKLTAAGVTSRWVGRGVTLGIWSWGFWVWLFWQLPFAILSLVFMALTEVVYQLSLTFKFNGKLGGYIAEGLDKLFDTLFEIVNYFSQLYFGIDLNILNPAHFFMLTHTLVIFSGWLLLLTIAFVYILTGQKAFSGKGAAGKNAMFLLAFVGYTIPVVNLLPLFFFWTLMVLKNPR